MISVSYQNEPFEALIACPSGPNFGAAARTITYFVIITTPNVERSIFDISIEQVPTIENGEFSSHSHLGVTLHKSGPPNCPF
jgi:hypothetical protein